MIPEIYFSVDVETAGPNPGEYALLSIGACLATDVTHTFYVELQPDRTKVDPGTFEIHGLSLENLSKNGQPPAQALKMFEAWVKAETPAGVRPIFVAFNAPFDWMFVNDYFLRYLDHNPFGHSALDMKALYMGLRRVPWFGTKMRSIQKEMDLTRPLSHHALQDAIDQAHLFQSMLIELDLKPDPQKE